MLFGFGLGFVSLVVGDFNSIYFLFGLGFYVRGLFRYFVLVFCVWILSLLL